MIRFVASWITGGVGMMFVLLGAIFLLLKPRWAGIVFVLIGALCFHVADMELMLRDTETLVPGDRALIVSSGQYCFGSQKIVLADGRAVLTGSNLSTVIETTQADSWWLQKHRGEVQAEITFLIWPKEKGAEPHFEKLVFK